MKKAIYLLLFLCFCTIAEAQHTNYKSWWQQIKQCDKDDLPKSALRITEQIRVRAKKEKNVDQWLAASLRRMHYRYTISEDRFYVDVTALEAEVKQVKTPIEKAFLHLFLGDIYATYYRDNSDKISKQIFREDTIQDVRLFSQEHFLQKIKEHLSLALKEEDKLHAISTQDYPMLIKISPLSGYYEHDMFHFMAFYTITIYRKLDSNDYSKKTNIIDDKSFVSNTIKLSNNLDFMSEALRLFQKLLCYYKLKKNDDAYLLTELFRLTILNFDSCYKHWEDLSKRFERSSVVVEFYAKMIKYLLEKGRHDEAMELAKACLNRYEGYDNLLIIRNLVKKITQPKFTLEIDSVTPNRPLSMSLRYKDISEVIVDIYKVNLSGFSKDLQSFNDPQKKKEFWRKHTLFCFKKTFKLPFDSSHNYKDLKLKHSKLNSGVYIVRVYTSTKKTNVVEKVIFVSELKLLEFQHQNKSRIYIVTDQETGHPIEKAKVLFRHEYGKIDSLFTNKYGEVFYSFDDSVLEVFASTKEDNGMQVLKSYDRSLDHPFSDKYNDYNLLYTDRSIYRPGQIVHVVGWCFEGKGDVAKVVKGEEFTFCLCSPNNELIDEKKVVSNEFGSFSLNFTLPQKTLQGNYRIVRIGSGFFEKYIRVEEYKRPTFQVELFPPTIDYAYGDTLNLKGKVTRFSGVPIQYATVSSSLQLKNLYYDDRNEKKTWNLKPLKTNEKGEFKIPFYLTPSISAFKKSKKISMKVTVTDATGETHDNSIDLPIGGTGIKLSVDIPSIICKEKIDSSLIKAVNLSGHPQKRIGTYQIYNLLGKVNLADIGKVNQDTLSKVMNHVGECLLTSNFKANEFFDIKEWINLPSGPYRMIITTENSGKKKDWIAYDFIVYSIDDKKNPIDTINWFHVPFSKFDEKKAAIVVLGSNAKDVYVYYKILSGEHCFKSSFISISNEMKKIEIPYLDLYDEEITVQFFFIQNNKVYANKELIEKIPKKKKQTLVWSSFRNHLQPGQKEEWEFQVLSPIGKPADAEVAAVLYDASLDLIYPYQWKYNGGYENYLTHTLLRSNKLFRSRYNVYKKITFEPNQYLSHLNLLVDTVPYFKKVDFLLYDKFTFCYNYLSNSRLITINSSESFKRFSIAAYASVEVKEKSDINKGNLSSFKIRDDFSETAFFYPHLRTDKEGKVRISFTLPDALTTWKFMALSHSKHMDYGKLVDYVTAKKEFMIAPHVPRFVREGDDVVLSSNLINLSAKPLEGKVVLEIFNPATEVILLKKEQVFQSKAGETLPIDFKFRLNGEVDLLAFRIKALSSEYSDGEQHYLPVLSRRQWVTQGLPLVSTKVGDKSYDLSHLFNEHSATATQRKLSIELTSYPYWTAVQALPVLSQPQYNNAIALCAAYYANKIGTVVVHSHPQIAQLIKKWQLKGEQESPLKLKKEVKQLLLQETPWVQNAEAESTARALQVMLLNENEMQQRNTSLVDRLSSLQGRKGGWSWFSGMPSDPYMTMEVMRILTRLSAVQGVVLDEKVNHMLKKAQHYLSYEVVLPWYKSSKKAHYEGLSYTQKELLVDYLYTLTLRKPQDAVEKRLVRHYLYKELPKIKEFTIYGKAIASILLHRAGMKKASKRMLASIREYCVNAPDKGSFFDTQDQAISRQYSIPRQVAVMEAAHLLGESDWLKELGVWLLLQKQVQQWSSPLSTVNAIYALTQLLPIHREANKVSLTYGKYHLTPAPNALGSINKRLREKEIPASMTPLIIKQEQEGLVYGGVYAQYFENVDKIKATQGALKIVSRYYKAVDVSGKKVLEPITAQTFLNKGDEVVCRMFIQCDRDFDYLQLKVDKASCLEADQVLSGYRYQHRVGYYCAVRDASMNYFFNSLSKGVYTLETIYHVVREGEYETGISTLQSAYAPVFTSHSPSIRLKVK